jgi:hypothetical protein
VARISSPGTWRDGLRLASILVLALLALNGCGGTYAKATNQSGTATPLTEPLPPRVIARDRALGERALLRQSDFPRGFNASPRGHNEPPQEERAIHLLQKSATCVRSNAGPRRYAPLTASVLARKNPATVSEEVSEVAERGPPETRGGNIGIESVVTVEPTVAAAMELFKIIAQPQLAACIGEAFRNYVLLESSGLRKPGNSVNMARVARLDFPGYGGQTVAYRLMFAIRAEGMSLSVYFDYVLIRKGRADAMLTFTRLDEPVSSAMERRLTALTARRLHL